MKRINEPFTEEEHAELKRKKGDRTWREAILEEFGVQNSEASEEDESAENDTRDSKKQV